MAYEIASYEENRIPINQELTNEEVISHMDSIYNDRLMSNKLLHADWLLQRSYVTGDQGRIINKDTFEFEKLSNVNGYQEKEVYNRLRLLRATYIARITRNKPHPYAKSTTLNERDKEIARITNIVLRDEYAKKQKMEKKIDRIGAYLADFGAAFIKVDWNKGMGEEKYNEFLQKKEAIRENHALNPRYKELLLKKIEEGTPIYQGGVETRILTPFQVFVDNMNREDLDDTDNMLIARAYPRETLKLYYGLKDEDFKDEDINSFTKQGGITGAQAAPYQTSYGYDVLRLTGHALLMEYYEIPSPKYQMGRYIMKIGMKVIYNGPLPYKNGDNGKREIPIIRVVADDDTFYGATPLKDLRPVQRRYNATHNRKAEALNRRAIGQWIVEEGSINRKTPLTNKPGAIIMKKPGRAKPERMYDNSNIGDFKTEGVDLEKLFSEMAGFNPAAQGQTPSSAIRSGIQMSMLTEQEDLRLGIPIKNIAYAIRDWAKVTIRLYKQFSISERVVEADEEYDETVKWTSKMITDNIKIDNINSLILSPTQQKQNIVDMVEMGVFDERNRYGYDNTNTIMEMFHASDLNIHIPGSGHIKKAERENQKIVNFKPIVVDFIDNHQVHLDRHTRFRISEDYETIMQKIFNKFGIEVVQKVEAMFSEHIKIHKQQVELQAMKMAQAMAQQGKN